MALGDTGINTTNVGTEIGQPSLDSWSQLVGVTGLNKYSRYAPGTLGVDGSKNITLSAPGNNYKIGDFRRYDHSAVAPSWWNIGTQYWGPGGSTANIVLLMAMETLNLQAFSSNGIDTGTNPAHYHVRVDIYTSSSDRASQTGTVQSFYPIGVDMVSHTPLSGHSRQVNWVMNTGYSANQFACNGVNVASGNCTRYCDVYFCDSSGANRIINFGTSVSAGYFDVSFHERQAPYLCAGAHTGTVPSGGGWTGYTYPKVNTSASTPAKCSEVSSIALTYGGSSYTFYLGLQGIRSGTQYMCAATADIRMTRYDPIYGSESMIISSGASLLNSQKIYLSGTLSGWSKGNTWYYDETATITIENITYGAYTAC